MMYYLGKLSCKLFLLQDSRNLYVENRNSFSIAGTVTGTRDKAFITFDTMFHLGWGTDEAREIYECA